METQTDCRWYSETLTAFERNTYAIRRTVVRRHTQNQEVEILDSHRFGRILVLDGRIQISEVDEFIYHEALVHPGLLLLDRPGSVMVVGGGPGATAREVLRYPTVKRVVMIDIDEQLVGICRSHLSEVHRGALDDPRVELHFEDAHSYVQNTDEHFDGIVVDLTAPTEEGPARLLWTKEFFQLVRNRLIPGGVMTTHAGRATINDLDWIASIVFTLQAVFPKVALHLAHVPCLGVGNPWGFLVCSEERDPRALTPETVDQRLREQVGELDYWDGPTHVHAFHLPKPVRRALEDRGRLLTASRPGSWAFY